MEDLRVQPCLKGQLAQLRYHPTSKVAVQVSRAQQRLAAHPRHQKALGWGMGVTAGQEPVREAVRGWVKQPLLGIKYRYRTNFEKGS